MKQSYTFDQSYELKENILKDLNYPLNKESMILDFGCGEGNTVKTYWDQGYKNTYGFDIVDRWNPKISREKFIASPEKIKGYENAFDFVFSDQVFEHVMDYPKAIRQLHAFLKPGGISLHFFPSKYIFIEPHIKVPLATFIQNKAYFRFWASLGIRNEFQKNCSIQETVEKNQKFCRENINYLPTSQIKALFSEKFEEVRFVEASYLKYSYGMLGRLPLFIKSLPGMPFLVRNFRTHVIFLKKSSV
jgi:SAM-dependent methyltransferase